MFPTTLLIIGLMSVAGSFTCSLLEAILLSTQPSHVELLVKKGRGSGAILKTLKERPGRALSAILLINTLAGTAGGTACGAAAAAWAEHAGWPPERVIALVAGVLSVGILVIGEITPKVIAASHWRVLASPAAYAIRALVIVLMPAVTVLDWLTRAFSGSGEQPGVTRDDMLVMSEMGRQSGTIAHRETEVIANLLRLNLMRTRDVITPRVDVIALQKDMTADEVIKKYGQLRYSRFPVYGKNADHIIGIVLRAQILEACLAGQGGTRIEKLKAPIHVVPESKPLGTLLDEFIKRHEHMFLVVNEYGGVEGLVTLEDVIETLLGVDINDEMDSVERMRQIAIARMEEQKRASKRPPATPREADHRPP